MNLLRTLAILATFQVAASHLTSFEFPGLGFSWYDPNCGFSCYNAIASAPLSCPEEDHSGGHSHGTAAAAPACQVQNTAFLTSVAYCLSTRCDPREVPVWSRERFWATKMIGSGTLQPIWTYSESLAMIEHIPEETYNSSSMVIVNVTMLISDTDYEKQFKFNKNFDRLEMLQARYA